MSLYANMLAYMQENTGHILFWLVLFILVLVLYVIYLARRITSESAKESMNIALASQKKTDDIARRIDELNHYLRDVFSKEFGGAMESFDKTVGSVLNEMKGELRQSVTNIERIESAVNNRRKLDLQAEAGRDKAQSLLTDKTQKAGSQPAASNTAP